MGKLGHEEALPKKWLSYIWEQNVESSSSPHNDELHVSLVDGRYQLSTRNAIYSFEDKYSNFTQAFKKIDLDKAKIEKVLVLGFGLGSIPFMLEKNFKRNYLYTGVEIDEEVIFLASKYMIPDMKSPIQLIQSDAYDFVESCNEEYDLIALDIFQDAVIPEKFESIQFFDQLNKILSDGGLLMFNRLYHTREDEKETEHYYTETFTKIYPDSSYIPVGGNWILINDGNLLL